VKGLSRWSSFIRGDSLSLKPRVVGCFWTWKTRTDPKGWASRARSCGRKDPLRIVAAIATHRDDARITDLPEQRERRGV